jgi:hypothetical protein
MDGTETPDEWLTHMSAAARHAGAGIALFDPEDRLRCANDWFREAYGVDPMLAPTWEAMMRGCHALRRGVRSESRNRDAAADSRSMRL